MRVLPLSFTLLTYSGYWRPISWSSTSVKYWAYGVYSTVMIFLLYSFTLCGLIDCFMIKDLENFIERFSLFLSVFAICIKMINLVLCRDKVIGLIDMLAKDICMPRDNREAEIQRRFDRKARTITIYCEILNESAAFFGTVAQLKTFVDTHTLPLSNWVPYDISSNAVYWATILHQTIALIVCASASVGHETLISSFMIQTCAQLDILCYRARTLPNLLQETQKHSISKKDQKMREQELIHELIYHHRYIYRLADTITTVFTLMILLQFIISSIVLCLSVYDISKKNLLSFEFVWSFLYLGCMLMQIYLYCWFGNEVTLKSTEIGKAIYEMDWSMFRTDLMKTLLIIIIRSKKPITITSGYIVTLSNESFMKIIRLSYSAYNVLKN